MPVVIQFLGRSGSGKSTLLAKLVEELGRERCVWLKNSRPPLPTAGIRLRAALRVVQLVRLLSTRNFLAREPSSRWRALRRAAFALGLTTTDLRRAFPRAEFLLLDELGAAGYLPYQHSLKRQTGATLEPLFEECSRLFGLPDVLVYLRVPYETVVARRRERGKRYDLAWLENSSKGDYEEGLREQDLFIQWLRVHHPNIRIIEAGERPDVMAITGEVEGMLAV